MTEGRALAPRAELPSAAPDAPEEPDASEGPDGAVREIEVKPEDVFQRERFPPQRWRERSFLAPVLTVIWMSTALVYGTLLLLGLLWTWVR